MEADGWLWLHLKRSPKRKEEDGICSRGIPACVADTLSCNKLHSFNRQQWSLTALDYCPPWRCWWLELKYMLRSIWSERKDGERKKQSKNDLKTMLS